MPQFDLFSFSIQSSWILFFFFSMYFSLLFFCLSPLVELIKIRHKLRSRFSVKQSKLNFLKLDKIIHDSITY